MPAAVLEYLESEDFDRIRTVQTNILEAYRLDLQTCATNILMKLIQVWDAIPSQLAKEIKNLYILLFEKGLGHRI